MQCFVFDNAGSSLQITDLVASVQSSDITHCIALVTEMINGLGVMGISAAKQELSSQLIIIIKLFALLWRILMGNKSLYLYQSLSSTFCEEH